MSMCQRAVDAARQGKRSFALSPSNIDKQGQVSTVTKIVKPTPVIAGPSTATDVVNHVVADVSSATAEPSDDVAKASTAKPPADCVDEVAAAKPPADCVDEAAAAKPPDSDNKAARRSKRRIIGKESCTMMQISNFVYPQQKSGLELRHLGKTIKGGPLLDLQ